MPLIAALHSHVCCVCSLQLTHQMTSHVLAAAGGVRAGLGAAADRAAAEPAAVARVKARSGHPFGVGRLGR